VYPKSVIYLYSNIIILSMLSWLWWNKFLSVTLNGLEMDSRDYIQFLVPFY